MRGKKVFACRLCVVFLSKGGFCSVSGYRIAFLRSACIVYRNILFLIDSLILLPVLRSILVLIRLGDFALVLGSRLVGENPDQHSLAGLAGMMW